MLLLVENGWNVRFPAKSASGKWISVRRAEILIVWQMAFLEKLVSGINTEKGEPRRKEYYCLKKIVFCKANRGYRVSE